MVLQIQYQPNAMMLGSMAQSAGEAAYTRWLTEFNQQKMQMNANAFQSGFVNMGLPIAQMQSRERMVNAQIAGRGQKLAQERMDDVQWWEDNGALVQDAVASNLIAQNGPSIINDKSFADKVVNVPKYMSRKDAQSMLTRHAGFDERARSHSVARSPGALVAKSAGRLAEVEAATTVNPVSQKQHDALQRRFNERGIKGAAYEKMRRGINERIKRYGDKASRRQTHEETIHALVRTRPVGDRGPFSEYETTILDPKGGPPKVTRHNPSIELLEQFRKNGEEILRLSEPPTEFGEPKVLTDADKLSRKTLKRAYERQNKLILQEIYGEAEDPAPDPMVAAQEYQEKYEVWGQQNHSSQDTDNQGYMDYLSRTGLLNTSMQLFKVSDPSELPAKWWTGMGFSAPPPKRHDDRGVMQKNEEETEKAVRHMGILKELEGLRTGQTPQQAPVVQQDPLRNQLQDIERQQQREAMAPKSVDEAKGIRRALAGKFGENFEQWPEEARMRWKEATEFISRAKDPKPAAPKGRLSPKSNYVPSMLPPSMQL
jgi:hypothetical protein